MSDLPLHPRLVHLPLGLGVALPMAAGAVAFFEPRGALAPDAWTLIVGLQALLVVSMLGALRSGELARTRVKPLVPEDVLCGHRRASRVYFLSSLLTLGAMVATALLSGPARVYAAWASVALGLVALVLGARAGRSGGELVFSHGAAQAYAEAGGSWVQPGSSASQSPETA